MPSTAVEPRDGERWNRNVHYHSDLLRLAPAERALDVGCGGGLLTRQLAPLCTSVVGIDPHEESIVSARQQSPYPNASYVVADVLDHPFEPQTFDLVVSVAALHHFDAETGLRRFAELLEPGGQLGIVGIGRSSYPRDLPRDVLAGLATQMYKRTHQLRAWHHAAPMVRPPPLTDQEMRGLVSEVLPGARFRRRIHGRYTITWVKP